MQKLQWTLLTSRPDINERCLVAVKTGDIVFDPIFEDVIYKGVDNWKIVNEDAFYHDDSIVAWISRSDII